MPALAHAGAGNLLGNLLCAAPGLLDGGTPLSEVLGELRGLLIQTLDMFGGPPVLSGSGNRP